MLNNMSIRVKLLMAFLAISMIPLTIVGYLAVTRSNHALSQLAFEKLENVREVKKTQIDSFFQERRRNMGALLESVTVLKQAAFAQMRSVQDVQQLQVQETVQQWLKDVTVLSKESSLQKMTDFEMLLDGQGGIKLNTLTMYEDQYFGDSLKHFIAEYLYADLLLITAAGNIVYSVNRDSDLGQNVLSGDLQDSSLASCFTRSLEGKGSVMQDFAPYPPALNLYRAFVAAPVMAPMQKTPVGVVVLKIDKQRVNAIVQRREGLGAAGESYLVAQQNGQPVLWSDQAFRAGRMGNPATGREVEQVLAGQSGEFVHKAPNGFMELVRYTPLHLPDVSWGMITVMRLEDVITPQMAEGADDYFARFIQQYGYADLALIHPDGDVFYSVQHAPDYGKNLFDGEYEETELARSVRAALTTKSLVFSDIHAYPAAQGKPVAFMVQPVLDQESVELIVAVQIPLSAINAVMQTRAGMGETGEAYLVGQDRLLRSDSYIAPEEYSVVASFAAADERRIQTPASEAALAGIQGAMLTRNYLGKEVLSTYASLKIGDTTWALMAEIERAEALAPAHGLTRLLRWMIVVIGGGVILLAVWVTTLLVRPIKHVAQILKSVSAGVVLSNHREHESVRRYAAYHDEIGIMSQAVMEMQTSIQAVLNETTRLIRDVQNGRLDVRGDIKQFRGDWQTLVSGINTVIEAFAVPITVTAVALEQLAKGDIPNKMTQEYQGEFNTINTNLNQLIGATELTTRIAENIATGDLTVNVQKRSDQDTLMQALQEMLDSLREVTQVAGEIAEGNLTVEVAKRSDKDSMMQSLQTMVESLRGVTSLAGEIAAGNLHVDIKLRSEKDSLMQALLEMVESLHEVTQFAENIADGDLTIEVNTRSETDRLMQALHTMVRQLNSIVLDAKTIADHISSGSRQLSSIAENVSQGSSQQAAAAEEASSSMEQMVANIRQNADNAKLTETMALESALDAQKGGEAVMETIEAMKKIEERISIIQEISMQTNILSMNATIEAAKAQDYGKGFAVVASEVRNLARRSRTAAEEIEQLVKSCVAISEQAGAVLERLVPNSRKTAELVQEINAASHEQHTGAQQVNSAIQQLDQVIQQNALTAEDMASSAEEFTSQVEQLREAMTFFTVEERSEEQMPQESQDFIHALSSFIHDRGANKEELIAMIEAMGTSRHEQQTTSRIESQSERETSPKDAEKHVHPSEGTEIKIEALPGEPDNRDEEFERF